MVHNQIKPIGKVRRMPRSRCLVGVLDDFVELPKKVNLKSLDLWFSQIIYNAGLVLTLTFEL